MTILPDLSHAIWISDTFILPGMRFWVRDNFRPYVDWSTILQRQLQVGPVFVRMRHKKLSPLELA